MRPTFITTISDLAEEEDSLVLITADLGFGVFDDFQKRFPSQFINVGICEQNMIGVATGLARSGYRPIVYSIANFPTLRCLEQIRNDAAYHEANILVVTFGGGFTYGSLGMSHHATEDLAIMRSLPGVSILCPSSSSVTKLLTRSYFFRPGTKYLRLEKDDGPPFPDPITQTNIGFSLVPGGSDGVIFTVGSITREVIVAVNKLKHSGLNLTVCSIEIIKPLDSEYIENILKVFDTIIVVEENNRFGALGSIICECLAIGGYARRFLHICVEDSYFVRAGTRDFIRSHYSLSSEGIVSRILSLFHINGCGKEN